MQPVPVPRDGRGRRELRGLDREDRHRRPGDGARRREELRVGRGGREPGSLRDGPRRAAARGRAHARHTVRPRRRGVRAHGGLRRRGRRLVRAAGDPRRGAARRSSGSPTRRSRTCATARTPTSAARCSPTRPGPGVFGGAQVLQGKEMSFNNWLDAWAAYDLAIALPGARMRHREAQQPVRCRRRSSDAGRLLPRRVRVRRGQCLRRDRRLPRRLRRGARPRRCARCSPRS